MAKKAKNGPFKNPFTQQPKVNATQPQVVDSLLDIMRDDDEYASIVGAVPRTGDIMADLKKAITEIEVIRGRPCVCYVANVINTQVSKIAIDVSDDLPFNEMIRKIPAHHKKIDIVLVTPGGSGNQISQFVNALRPRFDEVSFLLPHMCMSAGTLWALSGDEILMDDRAFIGPIDPQVHVKNGGMAPAQSILVLMDTIRDEGQKALQNGGQPPWHYIRLIDTMDPKVIGDAINQSNYSIKLASSYLETYKFKHWVVHSDNRPVTSEERAQRALEVAQQLCSNDFWKSHGHGITQGVANSELRIKIENTDSVNDLTRALRRLWCLFYYTFDRALITKFYLSLDYAIIRQELAKGN